MFSEFIDFIIYCKSKRFNTLNSIIIIILHYSNQCNKSKTSRIKQGDGINHQHTSRKDQLTKTPLELSLSEATSNENWNTSTKISQ